MFRQHADLFGLRPLLTLGGFELHPLALFELLEAGALDVTEVNEQVLTALIWGDEAVALVTVEPLHGALRHVTNS